MPVVIFILVLSFLIVIHELGHFLAARGAGIKVEEFGLGYPPRAATLFTWKKTIFSLNWIPFGGFVRIEGEDEPAGKFKSYAARKQLLVVVAGAVVNFLFGIIAFAIVFSLTGIPQPLNQPRISQVSINSPAAEAGLKSQTNIKAFELADERTKTDSSQAVIEFVEAHRGQEVTVVTTGSCQALNCESTEQSFELYLRTEAETPDDQGSMGVVFQSFIMRHYPWYQMPFRGTWYGLQQAVWFGQMILSSLGQLLTDLVSLRALPQELAGPIGIVHQASSQGIFAEGPLAVLSFAGMLSINLAVLNLLPIPALDGGRACFILIGQVIDKSKLEKIERWANHGGYIFLLGLLALVTIRDVIKLFDLI